MKVKYSQDKNNIQFGNIYFYSLITQAAEQKSISRPFYDAIIYFALVAVLTLIFMKLFELDRIMGIGMAAIVVFLFTYFTEKKRKSSNICEVDMEDRVNSFKNIEIELTDSEVILSLPGIKSIYSLDHINHYKVTDDYLILALGRYRGECIPLTAFESEADKNGFIEKLEQLNIEKQ